MSKRSIKVDLFELVEELDKAGWTKEDIVATLRIMFLIEEV